MNKRFWKHLLIISGILLLSIFGTYIGLALYYQNAFVYGTWINGIYCTGKSIEEVNSELSNTFQYDGLTIIDSDNNEFFIAPEDIDYRYDFYTALEQYIKRQNAWLWIDCFIKGNYTKLSPDVTYDMAKLEDCISCIPAISLENKRQHRLEIIRTNNGYELIDDTKDLLDVDLAKKQIYESIAGSKDLLSLKVAECYSDMELTEEMSEILKKWDKIQEFTDFELTYVFGEDRFQVDSSVVSDWILLDDNGQFVYDDYGNLQADEQKMAEFIDDLADRYDTVGKERSFLSTRGELVTVEGGNYGNCINKTKELEYLIDAFSSKKEGQREPEYTQKAMCQGINDIGDTYVEIDMTNQMLYYYENREKIIETPVVTGNINLRRGTPTGVNTILNKQRNRVLRGPGYASPVDYWVPVNGGIGIHDSSWRSNYGGNIYINNGSHGCINTPRTAMVELYDKVEIGMPVVMFY